MRLPAFAIGLAAGMTAAAGVLVLRLMEPTELDWSPFAYVAVASTSLAAAAGAVHIIQQRRARRLVARLRAVAADMEREGYFQPDRDRRLLVDAYDIPDLHDVFEEEK